MKWKQKLSESHEESEGREVCSKRRMRAEEEVKGFLRFLCLHDDLG